MDRTVTASQHELQAAQKELHHHKPEAYRHYLKAAYLHAKKARGGTLLEKARACYTKAQCIQGIEPDKDLTRKSLLIRTLSELQSIEKHVT